MASDLNGLAELQLRTSEFAVRVEVLGEAVVEGVDALMQLAELAVSRGEVQLATEAMDAADRVANKVRLLTRP